MSRIIKTISYIVIFSIINTAVSASNSFDGQEPTNKSLNNGQEQQEKNIKKEKSAEKLRQTVEESRRLEKIHNEFPNKENRERFLAKYNEAMGLMLSEEQIDSNATSRNSAE